MHDLSATSAAGQEAGGAREKSANGSDILEGPVAFSGRSIHMMQEQERELLPQSVNKPIKSIAAGVFRFLVETNFPDDRDIV